MTRDESRAVAFVGGLLLLALTARFLNRPKPITITAGAVDLAALQAAGRALAQSNGPSRSTRRPRQGTIATSPEPATEPRRPRPRTPPVFVSEPDPTHNVAAGPININRATVDQLDALPGIGPAVAKRIIARRDSIGSFRALEDLDSVKGIGPALLAKIRGLVVVR